MEKTRARMHVSPCIIFFPCLRKKTNENNPVIKIIDVDLAAGADPGGGPRGPGPPPDPRFWGPKIEHFWALFNFSLIFFASLRSAYYFFNILLFQSSNSKIFQPRFARHMISHLEVFVFSLSFTHFRLLGVHLSLSFF